MSDNPHRSCSIIASKFLLDFVEEEKEDYTIDNDGSEGKNEVVLQDELRSNSEEEASEDELPKTVTTQRKDYFVSKGVLRASYPKRGKSKNPKVTVSPAKDAFLWKKTPYTVKTKTKGKNICKIQPGLKSCAIDITDEVSAFQKMVDGEMVEDIVKFTNLYIGGKCTEVNYSRDRDARVTSVTEILALYGALFLIATKHGHHTNILELWNPDGTEIIALRAVMSYRRKKITLLGTIRKNKREIPSEFQPNKSRKINSSLFGFQKNATLVSYVPWVNKAIILLSSMHDSLDEHLVMRSTIFTLPADLSAYLKCYCPQVEQKIADGGAKRGRCKLCINNTSTIKCHKCGRFICKKHSKATVTCHPCLEENKQEDSSAS
ncbi:hypothetical protein J437_LFUL009975 [Ladona fulva]|uniref:PiggyBac transposable element-derived protein domain-containing protein n=1 Tax=Ladona fulva TaxID=123851 RepID=A0A8K0KGI2_LADFU|nr:hypothetical protein J437_LFUL009975 [Ladona fulva]